MPGNNHVRNFAIAPRNGNVFFMQSLNSIESSTFTNVVTRFQAYESGSNPVTWSDGTKNSVLYDMDGSLSGHSNYYCLSHFFQYYVGPGCVSNPTYDMCCPQQYLTSEVLCLDREAYGNYQVNDTAGLPACPAVNVMHQTRLDVQGADLSINASVYDLYQVNGNEQFNTLWAVNASYLISFDDYSPSWTGFQIANTYAGDWVNFAYCLPANAEVVEVRRGRALAAWGVSPTWAIYSQTSPIQPIATLAEFEALGATILWPNAGGYYFWDQQRNILHLHVQSRSFREYGSGDVNSDYCGLDGCDWLLVHTAGNNSGVNVNNCYARAFDSASNDGSLQITSGSAFFLDTSIGPRINGPVQHVPSGRAFYVNCGADQFYAQINAPAENDTYFTDDRGLNWISDDAFQYATNAGSGWTSGFGNRVQGDIYNMAFVYESVVSGNFEYKVNVTEPDTYVLSLYMMEVYWQASGQRLFNVLVNGQPLYNNVDIFNLSGGASTALQLHCFVNLTAADSVPVITIVSQRVMDNPIMSGFTIMPFAQFADTYPGVAIDAGTAANAPPIAGAPPVQNPGGGSAPTAPAALPVPAGWLWISPANTSYSTGGSTSSSSAGITVNTNSPLGVPLNSWEAAQPQLFLTNRFGSFSYSIPAPSTGAWQLRLLFAEGYWSTIGSRVFNVAVNGATVLSHLDLNTVGPVATQPATAGATSALTSTTAFVYAQTLQLTAGQVVLISFAAVKDNPLVCGVLLVPTNASTSTQTTASTGAAAPSTPAASTAAVAPSWVPAYSLLIDAGSSSSYTQDAHHVWQADADYNVAGLTSNGLNGQAYANAAANLSPVYNSNRYSASAVNYTLPVPTAGSYQLRLLFAETFWTSANSRLFDVEVQGVVIVPQLDIWAAAGGQFAAYDLYTNVTLTGQQRSVSVVLRNIKDNALISGLQLQSNF